MQVSRGRFVDFWNGDGWFVSLEHSRGWMLFALRPRRWRLRYVRLPGQPWRQRCYIGPFEIERCHLNPH